MVSSVSGSIRHIMDLGLVQEEEEKTENRAYCQLGQRDALETRND